MFFTNEFVRILGRVASFRGFTQVKGKTRKDEWEESRPYSD